MAVRDYPIDFGSASRNSQIVYSPHDYGPLVYEQPWFSGGFTYDSLYKDAWHPYWLYIEEENIAPILIGEWGGFMQGDNLKWMEYIRDLIGKENLHHTFWCFNANSGDTGGLVKDDFKTWDEEKYALVKPVLWQNSAGKFISLDHEIALGANGISLGDHAGNAPTPVINPDTTIAPEEDQNSVGNETLVEGALAEADGDQNTAPDQNAEAAQPTPDAAAPALETVNTEPHSGEEKSNPIVLIVLLVIAAALLGGAIIITMNNRDKVKKAGQDSAGDPDTEKTDTEDE